MPRGTRTKHGIAMSQKNENGRRAGDNLEHVFPYDDLRDWIAEADRLGELRHVTGANWQEEIGMAAEVVSHDDNAPAVLFGEVPGCLKGSRVLVNLFGGKRKNMTLGFPVITSYSIHYTKLYEEG